MFLHEFLSFFPIQSLHLYETILLFAFQMICTKPQPLSQTRELAEVSDEYVAALKDFYTGAFAKDAVRGVKGVCIEGGCDTGV